MRRKQQSSKATKQQIGVGKGSRIAYWLSFAALQICCSAAF
jgi:hypothetical protein